MVQNEFRRNFFFKLYTFSCFFFKQNNLLHFIGFPNIFVKILIVKIFDCEIFLSNCLDNYIKKQEKKYLFAMQNLNHNSLKIFLCFH